MASIIVASVMISTDESWGIANGSMPVPPMVFSAEGGCGAWGGLCVSPPSAKATAEIETTRRLVAKNRLVFDILVFPLRG